MDPLTMGLTMITGLGFQLFGMSQTKKASDQLTQEEIQKIQYQKQIEQQKEEQMHLEYTRNSLQVARNLQASRAISLTRTAGAGAQFGSALGGAYGGESGGARTNQLGLSQNFRIGENIFGLNAAISDVNIQEAYTKRDLQEAQGWSSIGQNISNLAPAMGRLFASGGGSSQSGRGPFPSLFNMNFQQF